MRSPVNNDPKERIQQEEEGEEDFLKDSQIPCVMHSNGMRRKGDVCQYFHADDSKILEDPESPYARSRFGGERSDYVYSSLSHIVQFDNSGDFSKASETSSAMYNSAITRQSLERRLFQTHIGSPILMLQWSRPERWAILSQFPACEPPKI